MAEMEGVSKLKAISQLIRLPNLIILVLLQTLLRYSILEPLLYHGDPSAMSRWYDFILQIVATLLLASGGYVINDYFDIKIDAINKPGKLVVDRLISARGAIKLHILLNILAIIVGFYLAFRVRSFAVAMIFPVISGMLWFYSARYKRMVLWGNLVVALFASLVILLTWVGEFMWLRLDPVMFITVRPELSFVAKLFFAYGLFAFLVSLFREIIKDLEDYKGDKTFGCRTLPIVAGINTTRWIVAGLVLLTIALLVYSQVWMIRREWYLVFWYFMFVVQLPAVYLLIQLFRAKKQEDFHFLSSLCKLIMFAGILSMELVSISI
jgi:4-hydroxybenzoate polyprenyltransferase